MNDLKNKIAVVTGGAGGIGYALAQALVAEGSTVVIVDRRGAEAASAAVKLAKSGARVIGRACDVTDEQDLERLCDDVWAEFGRVDLVFCNAGVMADPAPFLETPMNVMRWMFEVNVFGSFNTLQAFGKRMVAQGGPAHIVITGSENSICLPVPMMLAYNASKHAMLGTADMLRRELPEEIKVSLLCPGMVKTGLSSAAKDREEKYGGPQEDPFGGQIPFGMEPEDIARHTIEQVKNDAFYIVTHYSNRHMVEERYTELLAAFDEQTPEFEGWEAFDTRVAIGGILAEEAAAEGDDS